MENSKQEMVIPEGWSQAMTTMIDGELIVVRYNPIATWRDAHPPHKVMHWEARVPVMLGRSTATLVGHAHTAEDAVRDALESVRRSKESGSWGPAHRETPWWRFW
jgi:hypothetical protein